MHTHTFPYFYTSTNSHKKYILVGLLLLAAVTIIFFSTPNSALAAACTDTARDLEGTLNLPLCVINKTILPLLIGIEIFLFIFGVMRFMIGAGNEKERGIGKSFAIWGIIAIAVTVGVWGIVATIRNSFGLSSGPTTVRPLQFNDNPTNQ